MTIENSKRFGAFSYLKRALLLSSSAALVFAADVGPAHAQAAAEDTGLGDIIVTARKREENVLNIPVAVTAISGESLDNLGLRSIEDISTTTPSLSVARGSSGSGATLSLRGIGSTYTSIGIEQSVAVVVDGVYYGQGRIINEGFFDMSQVEVLRGPQSLFFGKNATSGVLSFNSANPSDEFEAMGRVGYEFTAEATEFEGVVSGPLTDDLSMRIALRAQNMGAGYVENVAPATTFNTFDIATATLTPHNVPAPERDLPQEEDLVGRVTLRYAPSSDFSMTFKAAADRYRVSNATWNNEMFLCPTGSPQVNPGEECNGDWRIHQSDLPADVAATNPLTGRHGGRLYQDYDSYSFTGNMDYSTDDVDFTWVTGFHHFVNYFLGDYDFTGAANGGTWGAERSEYQAFSTEFRAQSSFDGPVNFMVGGLVQATELNFNQHVIFPGGFEDSTVTDPSMRYVTVAKLSETQGQTLAAFGQLMWDVTPALEMALGARYTHETKDSSFVQPYVIAPYAGFYLPGIPVLADQSFNDLSPELSITWRPNDDWTLFAAYKQGFKSGGFSGSGLLSALSEAPDDFDFDPETVEGIEAGVRVRLLDDTLRLTLDAYSYEYSDLQVDFFDASTVAFTTYNAGSATTRGVELSAEWAPGLSGLVLTGSLAYNKAEYDGFAGAPCWSGQGDFEGCSDVVDGRPAQDLSGHATAMAPEWTGHVGVDYETSFGNGFVFGLTGNARYTSEYFLSAFGRPDNVQDAYWSLDGALRVGAENERWEVALIGRNLTDEYYLSSGQDSPSSGSGTGTALNVHADLVGTVNPPRTMAVQFTLRY